MQRPNPASAPEKPDISEHGGNGQVSDRRLFMQLLAFTDCLDTQPLLDRLSAAPVAGVLYHDLNDPRGVALLTFHEDPAFFVGTLRDLLRGSPFRELTPRPAFTMFGRSYSLGYEPDLHETLLARPRRTVLSKDWPWAIWYPLRRSGQFAQLPPDQQRDILMEHGKIGLGFGAADFAHDVRLACHGLDANDNDFLVGLVGKELHPLSAIVQTMRKTRQTSLYLERLGPFFVGRAAWRSDE